MQKGLKVEYRALESLIPYARNSRTHSDAQVAQIAGSLREFGFTNPVLVDGQNGIIAGHGRVLAARKLGMKDVPVIELAHLTEAQKRAYVIADNKMAEQAGWDSEILALEVADLSEGGFDVSLIGFSSKELADMLGGEDGGEEQPDDDGGAYREQYGVIVICSDAANQEETYNRLMEMGFNCKVVVT